MDKELIEKYRDINTDHEWWDYLYHDFTERMEAVGIDVDKMYFSGFYSQGDGACFEGRVDRPLRFLRKHFPGKYPMLRKLVGLEGTLLFRCAHSGHYYHENSTTFELYADSFHALYDPEDGLRSDVVEMLDELLDKELSDFEEDAKEIFRDYMRELYHELRENYEYLTSDEAVWEGIVANELDKEAA